MPARIVVQPNGLYARFSTIVDHFTHYNCTRQELFEELRFEHGAGPAEQAIKRGERSPDRFGEAIEDVRIIHGDDEARKYRELMTNAPQNEDHSGAGVRSR